MKEALYNFKEKYINTELEKNNEKLKQIGKSTEGKRKGRGDGKIIKVVLKGWSTSLILSYRD